ncbi:hypothetical protein [Streptomyces sp. NBC_00258]|uniref:hypothetical protein n=1 Tax=Streptomyces sp. NBC_00258 TaxID=2903642 RepID=UPI002E28D90C|nr:hypothetical protein [Streptomyces sp. NBC_00258]
MVHAEALAEAARLERAGMEVPGGHGVSAHGSVHPGGRRGDDGLQLFGEVRPGHGDLEVGVAVVAEGDGGGDELDDRLRRRCVPAPGGHG